MIQPLNVVDLFPEMRTELLRILHHLDDAAWEKPTACAGWSVKDVALHILADDIGYLSRHRDNDGITFVTDDFSELVALIDAQNDTWVRATRRMSKRVLLMLLEITGNELHKYLHAVDMGKSTNPIHWAGNQNAPMWLQIAREFTEYWMHHQHICEALNIESLKTRRFLHPVLSAFVFALPRTYADVTAADGTIIELCITGVAADSWYLVRHGAAWHLHTETEADAQAVVTMSDETAWHMFTKGISPQQVADQATIIGDPALGEHLFRAVAILA